MGLVCCCVVVVVAIVVLLLLFSQSSWIYSANMARHLLCAKPCDENLAKNQAQPQYQDIQESNGETGTR